MEFDVSPLMIEINIYFFNCDFPSEKLFRLLFYSIQTLFGGMSF